jgi:hypothetical protein
MVKSPDVPRLYHQGKLVAGDTLFLDVYLEDWLEPVDWLKDMYDHEVVHNREAGKLPKEIVS